MSGKLWIGGVALCSALLLGNAAPDAFDRVLATLASGTTAEQNGNTAAMQTAAGALVREGAAPLNDGSDLALRWLSAGIAAGGAAPTAAVPYRNRALGPGYRMIALQAGAATRFDQTFLAGQMARVAVVPLTKAEFGLSVRDDQGQPVCTKSTNAARCDWVPNWTTRYEIRVSNPGRITSNYYVVIQ